MYSKIVAGETVYLLRKRKHSICDVFGTSNKRILKFSGCLYLSRLIRIFTGFVQILSFKLFARTLRKNVY